MTECNNYRAISYPYKTVATLMKVRLEELVEMRIGEYQPCFRKSGGTADQILIMKDVVPTCLEYQIPVLILFIEGVGLS